MHSVVLSAKIQEALTSSRASSTVYVFLRSYFFRKKKDRGDTTKNIELAVEEMYIQLKINV